MGVLSSILSSILGGIFKLLPFLAAYKYGKDKQKLDTAEQQLENNRKVVVLRDKVKRMSDDDIDSGLSE